jgi:sec-independent protein translocase protein TatC
VIFMVLSFTIAGPIFNFLAVPVANALRNFGQEPNLIYTGLQQGFMVQVKLSIFGGFIFAFPIIAHQLWRFVAPGLYRTEKQAFLPFLIASPVLFFIGGTFAYFVVLPIAFNFFLGFQQFANEGAMGVEDLTIQYLGTINEYLDLTMKFIIAFGLCFQLPVLLTLMGKAGLVSAEGLGRVRKYAVVAILVVAALVTPPDVISQLVLFAAVYPLYEISIVLVRMVERKREAELRAAGLWDEEVDGAGAVKDEP